MNCPPLTWLTRLLPACLLVGTLAGCAGISAPGRETVAEQIQQRSGLPAVGELPPGQMLLPTSLRQGETLSEDEAVLTALWNNPAFHELLTELRLTRADLVQAGLLPNPEFVYFFPSSNKPFKYAFELPLEAIWLRPIRIRAAERENARTCERLTQAGLDLIRDARQAHAELVLARARRRVAQESLRIRGRLAELAEARLKAGDISAQDAATARVDALQARQELIRIEQEVPLAEERLWNVLGLSDARPALVVSEEPPSLPPALDVDLLTNQALRSRPDLAAADLAVAVAAERARLARVGWVRLLGILDATSGRVKGHEFSPAFRITLPLLNYNQGSIARADAERERAERQRDTARQRVILEVRQAHARFVQARNELILVREKLRPEVEAAIRRAEKAFKDGAATYLIVLEVSRQLIEVYYRQAQLDADLRRTWAELERSVGRRLLPDLADSQEEHP